MTVGWKSYIIVFLICLAVVVAEVLPLLGVARGHGRYQLPMHIEGSWPVEEVRYITIRRAELPKYEEHDFINGNDLKTARKADWRDGKYYADVSISTYQKWPFAERRRQDEWIILYIKLGGKEVRAILPISHTTLCVPKIFLRFGE